jgi:hypothetical protein
MQTYSVLFLLATLVLTGLGASSGFAQKTAKDSAAEVAEFERRIRDLQRTNPGNVTVTETPTETKRTTTKTVNGIKQTKVEYFLDEKLVETQVIIKDSVTVTKFIDGKPTPPIRRKVSPNGSSQMEEIQSKLGEALKDEPGVTVGSKPATKTSKKPIKKR